MQANGEPRELICSYCEYRWIYRGNRTERASCPGCQRNPKIVDCLVQPNIKKKKR